MPQIDTQTNTLKSLLDRVLAARLVAGGMSAVI
jgi:hypothetical protein